MPVCSVSADILIGSDSILREVGAGGAEENQAIKRFRNRAISNRDFISISINRTALSQTHCFLQSPSFQQVQSALIGQRTHSIVIGQTPQVGNVTPLSITASFSFQSKYKDS